MNAAPEVTDGLFVFVHEDTVFLSQWQAPGESIGYFFLDFFRRRIPEGQKIMQSVRDLPFRGLSRSIEQETALIATLAHFFIGDDGDDIETPFVAPFHSSSDGLVEFVS